MNLSSVLRKIALNLPCIDGIKVATDIMYALNSYGLGSRNSCGIQVKPLVEESQMDAPSRRGQMMSKSES